jgi:hypothetical protein
MPAPTRLMPDSVRQLQWLLFSLLVFGLLLSLPSEATATHAIERNHAERLFGSDPFVIASNDLLRAVRSENSDTDDDSCDQPLLVWLSVDSFQPATSIASIYVSIDSILHPLPISTLPGAPRGPPVISL